MPGRRLAVLRGLRTAAAASAVLAAAACGAPGAAGGGSLRTPVADSAVVAADVLPLRVRVHTAHTMRGHTVPLSGGFTLELRGDSVFSCLPYFGRAYSATAGTDSPLTFGCRMTGFTAARAAAGLTRVEFDARAGGDTYRFRIDMAAGGGVTVSVRPQQRDRITFDGEAE